MNRPLRMALESGLIWVICAMSAVTILNLATLIIGTSKVLLFLNSNSWGILISFSEFDSWGTIGGLLGIIILFCPVLFGTRISHRVNLSVYLVVSSIVIGLLAGLIWNRYYNSLGEIPVGASSIAITGQAIVFALAILGMIRLLRQDTRAFGSWSKYWWKSFAVLYVTLIGTTILFVGYLQSIFVPSDLYNWRVHQFGFFMGVASTLVYGAVTYKGNGLDGKISLDESLMGIRFDDINFEKFGGRLPHYRVRFKPFYGEPPMECHAELKQIFVKGFASDQDYRLIKKEFDAALVHEMIHIDLHSRGEDNWQHGKLTDVSRFDEIAASLGATPEAVTHMQEEMKSRADSVDRLA